VDRKAGKTQRVNARTVKSVPSRMRKKKLGFFVLNREENLRRTSSGSNVVTEEGRPKLPGGSKSKPGNFTAGTPGGEGGGFVGKWEGPGGVVTTS